MTRAAGGDGRILRLQITAKLIAYGSIVVPRFTKKASLPPEADAPPLSIESAATPGRCFRRNPAPQPRHPRPLPLSRASRSATPARCCARIGSPRRGCRWLSGRRVETHRGRVGQTSRPPPRCRRTADRNSGHLEPRTRGQASTRRGAAYCRSGQRRGEPGRRRPRQHEQHPRPSALLRGLRPADERRTHALRRRRRGH